jgi:hypothetical protein
MAGNPATLAPRITPDNAREMQRRATQSRLAREAREKAEDLERDIAARARILAPEPDEARRQRTLKQIDLLDKRISAAMDDDDDDRAMSLIAAKERLWKLVQPTAGSLRPGRSRREAPPSITAPVPISAPVAQPAPPAFPPGLSG